MRLGQLRARRRRPFRVTTDSGHAWPVVANHLARRCTVAEPNRVWAADITALPTGTGAAYQTVLAAHGIRPSMSRVGDCWDNAPVESFFRGLKREGMPDGGWATPAVAQLALTDHIEFCNRRRLHSANDYRSPVETEAALDIPV
jgi:transposase InsO family protein